MVQRTRRSNAGNRLQSLLAGQTPLNDEDAEFFAEREDDEDFDLEAEEERQRRERLEAEQEDKSEEGDENDSDDGSDASSGEHDDSNFSDTSDDSDSDRDEVPVDAGEKELQKEQRQKTREKRVAERNKMLKIKRRPPPRNEDEPRERKKKRVFMSADILLEKGRHSERKSALRNKRYLIEQMREAELRRAQYVPPKRKKVAKLTQEERLEEAKKTEARNLSSLNKLVELEEDRKVQQRLAMISRRPKLTHFVRFHSSQYWEQPKLITVKLNDEDELNADDDIKQEPGQEKGANDDNGTPAAEREMTPIKQEQPEPLKDDVKPQTQKDNAEKPADNTEQPAKPDNDEKDSDTNQKAESNKVQQPKDTSQGLKPESSNEEPAKTSSQNLAGEKSQEPNQEPAAQPEPKAEHETASEARDDSDLKPELDQSVDIKEEIKPEILEEKEVMYGPVRLRNFNFLTLHEFADVHINKYSIRSIVLGPVASTHTQPPLKRMCPFTGKEAKYLDPNTSVAYTDLATNKLIKRAHNNELGWSKELGGVFTLNGQTPRHAKGVPEGFA